MLRLGNSQSFEIIEDGHENGIADQVIRKLHRVAKEHNAVVVRPLSDERKKKVAAEGHDCGMCSRKSDGSGKMLRNEQ